MSARPLRVRLIHWNAAEAREKAAALRAAGWEADAAAFDAAALRALRKDPPAAVVIDLTRSPSQGRDVALALRSHKATRCVPLLLVGGDPDKVARIKAVLPDAAYTAWSRIRSSLKRAVAHPPKDPVVPRSVLDGYAATPLPKKLGIKPGSIVVLVGAPDDIESTLGPLPQGVTLRRSSRGRRDLTVWFARSPRGLERRIGRMAAFAEQDRLWIAWPKKSSGRSAGLSETLVRKVALAAGLVDFKVCAIDATWAALRFSIRKAT